MLECGNEKRLKDRGKGKGKRNSENTGEIFHE